MCYKEDIVVSMLSASISILNQFLEGKVYEETVVIFIVIVMLFNIAICA